MIPDKFNRLRYLDAMREVIDISNKKLSGIAARFGSGEVVAIKTIAFGKNIVSCERVPYACSECGHVVEAEFSDIPPAERYNSRCFLCKKETEWALKREEGSMNL